MKKYLTIWKGIVSKKTLRDLCSLISRTENWSIEEDEHHINIYSTDNSMNKEIKSYIVNNKIDIYTVWW